MFKNSQFSEAILRAIDTEPLLSELPPSLSFSPVYSDFRRQALKPSKWREYREREREKNRASMKAMGLSGNVFEWPGQHMPACMVARLYRNGASKPEIKSPEMQRRTSWKAAKIDGLIPVTKHG